MLFHGIFGSVRCLRHFQCNFGCALFKRKWVYISLRVCLRKLIRNRSFSKHCFSRKRGCRGPGFQPVMSNSPICDEAENYRPFYKCRIQSTKPWIQDTTPLIEILTFSAHLKSADSKFKQAVSITTQNPFPTILSLLSSYVTLVELVEANSRLFIHLFPQNSLSINDRH